MLLRDRIYFFLILSLLIYFLDFFTLLKPIKYPIDQLVVPVKKSVYTVRVHTLLFIRYIFQYSTAGMLSKNLKSAQQSLEEARIQSDHLRVENEKLRLQLGARLPASFQFVPAHILSATTVMEIDAGEKQGITPGMTVVLGTTFVGRIKSVSPSRSIVLLPTDPDFHLDAKTERNAKGVLRGQLSDTILFEKVLQKDTLFLDDIVLTSGEQGVPADLTVGKVTYISVNDTSAYKQAKVAHAFDTGGETIVFIIISL